MVLVLPRDWIAITMDLGDNGQTVARDKAPSGSGMECIGSSETHSMIERTGFMWQLGRRVRLIACVIERSRCYSDWRRPVISDSPNSLTLVCGTWEYVSPKRAVSGIPVGCTRARKHVKDAGAIKTDRGVLIVWSTSTVDKWISLTMRHV